MTCAMDVTSELIFEMETYHFQAPSIQKMKHFLDKDPSTKKVTRKRKINIEYKNIILGCSSV